MKRPATTLRMVGAILTGGAISLAGILAAEPGVADAAAAAASAEALSDSFRFARDVIQPSVVSITSEMRLPVGDALRDRVPGIPDGLRRFFGDRFGEFFEQPSIPEVPGFQRGTGSGVIIAADGIILTNSHVVAGADEITVRLHDESTHKATVVGTDPRTEVAVIKITAKQLRAATLADSDKVQICDWVLAIGGPFGLTDSVTAGIVSAKGRSTVGIADYENFIQTDAAINPGNSGGPLINMRGEVVGINTAIATRTGGNMGVGFSIPSNMAKSIADKLIEGGRVDRGFLGARIQDLTPELAGSFGFEGDGGVLLSDVIEDAPAEKAGLRSGDIVTKLDGVPMSNASQLRNRVAETAPGSKVEVEIFSGGHTRSVVLELGQLEDGVAASGVAPEGSVAASELGITVGPLLSEVASQLGLGRDGRGVIITGVEPGSFAERGGLRQNDVIIALDGEVVESPKAFDEALRKRDLKRGIRMQIFSDGFRRFLFLRKG